MFLFQTLCYRDIRHDEMPISSYHAPDVLPMSPL